MNLPYLIAKALYDHGIRLENESSNCALNDKLSQRIKDDVANLVLDHGNRIELTYFTDKGQAIGRLEALMHAAWFEAWQHLTEAVDEELWIYQNERARARYEGEQIDHIKEMRGAA